MAVIDPSRIAAVYTDGSCEHTILFSFKNVTAADTADLSAYFSVIKRAGLISATGTTIASVSISGTTVTIPSGPSSDGVWILAVGVTI